MALLDDIRDEIADLIDSVEETRTQAAAFARESVQDGQATEQAQGRAAAVIQRMDELLAALRGVDLGEASVQEVSALIESSELALDQADEVLDELDV